MPTAYFNSFDVIRIGADSIAVRLSDEEFNVEIVGGASLGTVTSDEFGHIVGGPLAAAAGTEVEFSHAVYPETFRRALAASDIAAANLLANATPTYIAENLQAGEAEAVTVALWLHNKNNPNEPDHFLGYGIPGTTPDFPFPGEASPNNYRVFSNPSASGGKYRHLRYKDGPSADFDMSAQPSTSGRSYVFSETVGTSGLVNIWSDGGVEKARKASALVAGKRAHGFAPTGVLATEEGDVFFVGNIISNLAGLTPGQSLYLSETGGEMTAVPPTLVQHVGAALDATTAIFEPHPPELDPDFYVVDDDGPFVVDDDGAYVT